MAENVRAPSLRELILRALTHVPLYEEGGPADWIARLALDEIDRLPLAPLGLPLPRDANLHVFADAIIAEPHDRRSLADRARELGFGTRTFARRFPAETGMPPGAWRRQARLLAAFGALAEGASVTAVALDFGYETTSGFIEAFRQAFGITPGAAVRAGNDEPGPRSVD